MSEMELANEARQAEARDYHDQQKKRRGRPKKADKAVKQSGASYKQVGDKVVMLQETDRGTFSTYVGKMRECSHLVK